MKKRGFLTAYEYLFYRIYIWQRAMYKDSDTPKVVAILTLSLFLFVNVLTLFIWLQILTGERARLEPGYAIFIGFMILAIHYIIFIYQNKFEEIVTRFDADDNIQRRKRRTIWCWVYAVAIHLLFFVSVSIFSPGLPR